MPLAAMIALTEAAPARFHPKSKPGTRSLGASLRLASDRDSDHDHVQLSDFPAARSWWEMAEIEIVGLSESRRARGK